MKANLLDILRHHQIALSILEKYPDGLEDFKLAIKQEAVSEPRSLSPQANRHDHTQVDRSDIGIGADPHGIYRGE
jgi:hypothetical protein